MKKIILTTLFFLSTITSKASELDSIVVSPFPIRNQINFSKINSDKTLKLKILIYDKFGKLIKQTIESNSVQVSDLNNGKYMILVIDEKDNYFKKIIEIAN